MHRSQYRVSGMSPTRPRGAEAMSAVAFGRDPCAMWVYDPATLEILDVNAAALRLFGRARKAFLAEGWPLLWLPEEAEAGRKRASASERLASGDWQFVSGEGRVIDATVTCHSTVHQGRGARLAIAADVTDQRRAEQDLRASEERWRKLIANSDEILSIVDADGHIVYANRAGQLVLGYDPEERGDGDIFGTVREDYLERVAVLFQDVLSGAGAVVRDEIPVVSTDGTTRWSETTATNLLDDPVVRGIVVHARDVTARREMQDELRVSEERFRLVVENSTDIVTILDPDGSVRYTNPTTARVLGYDDPLPPPGSDGWAERVLHPDDRERVLAYVAGAFRAPGVAEKLEYRFKHADGSWRYLETIANNLLADDRMRGVLLISRDITEREHAKESEVVTPVLSDLLVGAVDVDLARGWEAGLDRAPRYDVVVTRLHGPGFHLTEPLLLDVAQQVGAMPGGLCGAFGAFGVLIVPAGGSEHAKGHVGGRLLAELAKRLPSGDLRVAVGGPRPAARGIQWSFEEAVRLLSLADRLDIDGLVTPRRAVLPLILDGSPRTALSLLKVLQPLLDADQRSRANLVETLRSYLDNDASVHKTAEDLHVHRNTIRSRLRTIEKALGGPVSDDKVVLQMALLAQEMAGSSSDDARDVSPGEPGG
jgi:PAS domain S-box-containing protein